MAKKNELKVKDNYEVDATGEQEFNGLMLAFQMGVMGIGKIAKENKNNPDVLWDCAQDYLKLCAQFGMRVGNLTFYTALGITKQTASQWRNGERKASDPRYRELIEYVDSFCSMNREMLMLEGRLNPATGIWWQKNLDGFRDNPPDTIIAPTEEIDKTPEQIREQYKYLVTVEAAESPDTGPKTP